MLTDFDEAVSLALQEGYLISTGLGTDLIYELFNHLSTGGTVYDFDRVSAQEMPAVLGTAYVTLLRGLENIE